MNTKRMLVFSVWLLCLLSGWNTHAFYNPSAGRWLSRDPVGEKGGNNLFAFVHNGTVNSIDLLGLAVRLAPWNGEAVNRSKAATVTIKGDWATFTFVSRIFGQDDVTIRPWSVAELNQKIRELYQPGNPDDPFPPSHPYEYPIESDFPDSFYDLGPGRTMKSEWDAGRSLIVDSDFMTGATAVVYSNKQCCKLAKLPVKIGWGILTVYDCKDKQGIWYDIDAKFRPW